LDLFLSVRANAGRCSRFARYWHFAAADYGVRDVACPPQYRWGQDAALRNAAKDQAELRELKLKSRPASHAPRAAK